MKLGEQSRWATFSLGGKDYEFELWEAMEFIGEIASCHQDDLSKCLNCLEMFAVTDINQPDDWKPTCPKCGSNEIQADQTFVDETVKMIKEKYGVPRCSRSEARDFERLVRKATDDEKKTSTKTAG